MASLTLDRTAVVPQVIPRRWVGLPTRALSDSWVHWDRGQVVVATFWVGGGILYRYLHGEPGPKLVLTSLFFVLSKRLLAEVLGDCVAHGP